MPGSIVQGVASIQGGKIAASASKKAARLQNEQFLQTRRDLLPFLEFGQSALGPLSQLFGLGEEVTEQGVVNPEFKKLTDLIANTAPTVSRTSEIFSRRENDRIGTRTSTVANPEFARLNEELKNTEQFLPGKPKDPLAPFIESPGFRFRQQEGIDALDRSASARGQLLSGAQRKEVVNFGQNLASAEFNSFVDRLASFAGGGQTSGAQIGQLGAQAALARGSFIQQAGGQRASGLIGAANAFASGQQRFENNALSLFGAGAGAAGGLGAAAAACTIAREVYGIDSPKWLMFREWLFREAPVWLFRWYLRNQFVVAKWLSDKPGIKWVVRKLMDRVI